MVFYKGGLSVKKWGKFLEIIGTSRRERPQKLIETVRKDIKTVNLIDKIALHLINGNAWFMETQLFGIYGLMINLNETDCMQVFSSYFIRLVNFILNCQYNWNLTRYLKFTIVKQTNLGPVCLSNLSVNYPIFWIKSDFKLVFSFGWGKTISYLWAKAKSAEKWKKPAFLRICINVWFPSSSLV